RARHRTTHRAGRELRQPTRFAALSSDLQRRGAPWQMRSCYGQRRRQSNLRRATARHVIVAARNFVHNSLESDPAVRFPASVQPTSEGSMPTSIPRRRRLSFFVVLGLVVVGAQSAHAKAPSLRFESGLEMPASLEARVRFWIDVFTKYSQQEAIVHDREQPLVLAVVPLKSGSSEELQRIQDRFQSLAAQIAAVSLDQSDNLLASFRAPLDPRWIANA